MSVGLCQYLGYGLLSIILSCSASALEVRSSFLTQSYGSIVKVIEFSCDSTNAEICQQTCGGLSCLIEEPACTNCVGTGSELLRTLFTKPAQYYRANGKTNLDSDVLRLIVSSQAIVIDSQSIFNLYTSVGKKESLPALLGLCPVGATNAAVVVRIDESGFPIRPVASICDSPDGGQKYFGVSAINDNISIEQTLQAIAGQTLALKVDHVAESEKFMPLILRVSDLNLKMDTNLTLPMR